MRESLRKKIPRHKFGTCSGTYLFLFLKLLFVSLESERGAGEREREREMERGKKRVGKKASKNLTFRKEDRRLTPNSRNLNRT